MAEKTILYEVTMRNGHGEFSELHVGQTKDRIRKAIENRDVKVERIKSLGQKKVDVAPGEIDDVEFSVRLSDDEVIKFDSSCIGYAFLNYKFKPQVEELKEEINKGYEE
ncbi:hypothetical protein [Pseudomonas ogarae]|uniref:Phage protein n=1 Tax=Pseudomonas ogarae (strain DSM 112162 / CECT 30235 / F113) TaxID=1114970 RepID=A0ABN5GA09_PSEO1|nr:hypothetical protein [Pseudomonas ogarae]AUO48107.1 hypothetical protein C1C98_22925 [Pseudomonas ogarae]